MPRFVITALPSPDNPNSRDTTVIEVTDFKVHRMVSQTIVTWGKCKFEKFDDEMSARFFQSALIHYLLDLIKRHDGGTDLFSYEWRKYFGSTKNKIKYVDHGIPANYPFVELDPDFRGLTIKWYPLDVLIRYHNDEEKSVGLYSFGGNRGFELTTTETLHKLETINMNYSQILTSVVYKIVCRDLDCKYMSTALNLITIEELENQKEIEDE